MNNIYTILACWILVCTVVFSAALYLRERKYTGTSGLAVLFGAVFGASFGVVTAGIALFMR